MQTPGWSFNSAWSSRTPAIFSMASRMTIAGDQPPTLDEEQRLAQITAPLLERAHHFVHHLLGGIPRGIAHSRRLADSRGTTGGGALDHPEVGQNALQHGRLAGRGLSAARRVRGCRPWPKWNPRISAAARNPSGNSNGYSMASNSSSMRYCQRMASSYFPARERS